MMAELTQVDIQYVIEEKEKLCLIDVRSPGEFKEFHIPGAVSMPLFSNSERAEVGTLFKQKGPECAKDRGLEIVSVKLPALYKQIKTLKQSDKELVIYCWRGGMRSKSLATFMTMMGVPCSQLKGGIRSFRRHITDDLDRISQLNRPFIVLEGFTGSQKTDILLGLGKKGYPVIDLEGLAGHRGSIFGSVGLEPKSQKAFECGLWQRFNELKDAPFYIIEGESKRIGRVILPDFISKGKEKGIGVFLHYPFEKRVEAIIREYVPDLYKDALFDAYTHLKKYLDRQLIAILDKAFDENDWRTFVSLLLEHYYDPRYRHKQKSYERDPILLKADNIEEGIAKFATLIDEIMAPMLR